MQRPAELIRPAAAFNHNVITQAHAPCHVSVTRLRQQFSPYRPESACPGAGPVRRSGDGENSFGIRGSIRARAQRRPLRRSHHARRSRPPRAPTIGLALGGGAARGFAHIGVMRTLAAHGIVPDVIVGTSIGAVVGGCYAARQLDNLENWARALTVRSVLELSRHQPVRLRPYSRRPPRHNSSTRRSPTAASTICRSASPPSPPNSTPAMKSGSPAAGWPTRCALPMRCREFSRRC